ncbi:MAG: pyruvate kinase [Acidobacteriota bacterium]|nr:MAG: pyruvate kinase [Acidobacteriota bacterium]
MRRAKILATLGPSSNTQEQIAELIKAGANAVRVSMSHGTREEHEAMIDNARKAAVELDSPLSVLVDLSGPKIRTRSLKGKKPVLLKKEQRFVLTTRDVVGTEDEVGTNFSELPHVVDKGSQILLDDGSLELKVTETTDTDVICEVVSGGLLYESKGINLPGTHLPIPSLTEKDRDDLDWALEQDVDYIALSFVRRASDCEEVKKIIKENNKRKFGRALLVAKIEKAEAIENLDEIIAATDGLMVARGDLGVETSVELVPVYQKEIIRKSIANDKFVITATQMLQTMIDNPRPTRAEASDVANAVWDGTDAVMLSAETAAGSYTVESVRTMAKIIESSESIRDAYRRKSIKFSQEPSGRTSQALCKAAGYCAQEIKTNKIAVFTESGLMARRLSAFRSGLQTYALTTSWRARNQLALIWGVRAFYQELTKSTEDMLKNGEKTLLRNEAVESGETIVMMAGRLSGLGLSSSVVVWTIGEDVPRR